jgi:hypothetical protein
LKEIKIIMDSEKKDLVWTPELVEKLLDDLSLSN